MAESDQELLLQLEQALWRARSPEEVQSAVVGWAIHAAAASYGGLILLEEGQRGRMVLPRRDDRPPEKATAESLRRALRLALSSWTQQRWAELLVPDTRVNSAWASVPGLDPIRGILGVPLTDIGRLRGIVLLVQLEANRFTPRHARLLRGGAPLITAALAGSRSQDTKIQDPARLAAIMGSLTEPLFAVDAAGRVVLTNPPLERLLGRPTGEILGRDFRQAVPLQHPSQPDVIAQVLRGSFASFNLDMVLRIASGEDIPVRVGCGAIPGPGGRASGAAVILHDIRYLREIEGLREDLSNMLVHDLKGPLAAIASTIQLLQQYPPARLGEATLQELLSIADQGARRLGRLIEAVLDVQHLEVGQFPLALGAVDLTALAVEVLAEVGPLAAASEVQTAIQMPGDLPAVTGDAGVLGRVLWNLLDNALKYTPHGGKVLISACVQDGPTAEAQPVPPAKRQGRRWVLVRVADTGMGIPPDERERIFGKFAQGRRGPLRRRGIGLGLAFCRLAIESHGGQIWVESDSEGGGSIFSFTLPARTLAEDTALPSKRR